MLINAGGRHPHALWLERLREGGRLVVPLTIAASPTLGPTLGQGAMVRIVRQSGGFSANIVTFLAIFNGGNLRDPELEAPLRSDDYRGIAQAEVAAPRLARAGRVLSVPHSRHVPERRRADSAPVGVGL